MKIPEAHLPARALRSQTNTRAFPLIGPGLPRRTTADPEQLRAIIEYLAVERSPRYAPTPTQTFCNIYAHDYAHLAGAYLPRVWWTPEALRQIEAGLSVKPVYGQTVTEMNANALYLWLVAFGSHFGWQRSQDLNQVQASANAGCVALISAMHRDRRSSGHISAVAPETPDTTATWRDGHCVVPVQSQAGRRNVCAGVGPGRWWDSPQFAASGFWIHP
jgi:hypothetical protein